MEFEDILREVGDWGRFQKLLLMCFGASIGLLTVFPGMDLIFMMMIPNHQCLIPSDFNVNGSEMVKFPHLSQNSSCKMLSYTSETVNSTFVNNTLETNCAYGWKYDKTYFESTASSKWNMVCKDNHYPSLVLTLNNVGSLIGILFYSALADRYGRKTVCFSLLILSSVTELISVFMDNFLLFAFFKIINGSFSLSIYTLSYILISEMVSPNKRAMVNVVINMYWMAGMCLLPLFAYMARSWIMLGVISSSLTALLLLFWKYVPESASWLLSQKRYEDAAEVMMSIGKANKKSPDIKLLEQKLKAFGEKTKQNKADENHNFFSYIIKYPRLRKYFIILTICWTSKSVAYLGFQYNVINLEGNVFLNFFFLSLAEFPGTILFWILMEKVGRRWTTTIGFLGISLCCLLPFTGFKYVDTFSLTIGKIFASGIYMVADQQGCEIYPTVARSLSMGIGKAVSMTASLFTPYLAYLSIYGKTIPYIVIGATSFLTAILSSFLPETLNENLPQTFCDAEEFGKDQKYFSFKKKKMPLNRASSVKEGDEEVQLKILSNCTVSFNQ